MKIMLLRRFPFNHLFLIWALIFPLISIYSAGCEPGEKRRQVGGGIVAGEVETKYRRLILPNQLKVMLVSDTRADRSAGAMSVGVGSLDDPADRPGLVHFLEHMLFLGTEKYPEPGLYQQFVSSHAGFSNAYTADDHTNYFFEVSHDGFEKGLDIFAQFFIAPLFTEKYVAREMNAVDSEHSKNLENDTWRVRQVRRSTYDSDHPINRFSTGNLKTLTGVSTEELKGFYRNQYSSNKMSLALVSNLTLDQLEELVRGRFDDIPNRSLGRNIYPEEFLKPKEALRILSVEPFTDQRAMIVEFPLPPIQQHYKIRPLHLISSILGDEGAGSLLSLLKEENLASSLSAGGGESTADYASFSIRVGLTKKGLTRYQDILGYLLGAIKGLRENGIPRYIFEENRKMAELNYKYREKQDSSSLARGLSSIMQKIPIKELPQAAYIFTEYNPKITADLLSRIHPGNMMVTLIAKGLDTDMVEENYQTKYSYREISGGPYQKLNNAEPNGRWRVTASNPYIPKRVNLKTPQGPLKMAGTSIFHLKAAGLSQEDQERLSPYRNVVFTGREALKQEMKNLFSQEERVKILPLLVKNLLPLPVKLIETKQAEIWFQNDWRFRQPKAEIILKIYTEGASGSPREVMLGSLYEAGIEESLNEFGYPIKTAGLFYKINSGKSGITLTLGGYSTNILNLLQNLAGRLKTVDIDQKRFDSIKERMQRALQNARFDQPYNQARYYRSLLLEEPNFTRESREEALKTLTLENVKAYAASLYKKIYVEGVVYGNLSRDTAKSAISQALASLGNGVLPAHKRVENQIRSLPSQADYVYSRRLQINNSLASYYYQVGKTNPRLRGALLMISRRLSEQFYFNMRTQQQLGYIVWSGMGQTKKTLGLHFLIQSGAYSADILFDKIQEYIPKFAENFKKLPEGDFEKIRKAVIQAKLERPNSISEAAGGLFWRAFEKEGQFDHVSQDIKAVQELTRGEVEDVIHKFMLGKGVRKLAVRLLGKDHKAGKAKGNEITIPQKAQAAAG